MAADVQWRRTLCYNTGMSDIAKQIAETAARELRAAGEETLADIFAALAAVPAVDYCAKARSATVRIDMQNGRVTYIKPEFSFKNNIDFLVE